MKNINFSIQELINDSVRADEREDKKQTSWHASSIGNCLRGQYIKRLGIIKEEPMDDRQLRVFKVGIQMEEWVVNLLKKQLGEEQIKSQVRIEEPSLGITGYVDAVVHFPEGERPYEIKTKHSRAFWYMEKDGKPMRQHEYQLWLYLRALNLPEGVIAYLSKDDLAIAEYVVRLDDEILAKEVLDRVNSLNQAWEKKDISLLPLPEKGSWQGKYCRLHEYCINPAKIPTKKHVVSTQND